MSTLNGRDVIGLIFSCLVPGRLGGKMDRTAYLAALAIVAFLAWKPCSGGEPDRPVASPVVLAEDGVAQTRIVVGPEATRAAAEELADYLGRISGAVVFSFEEMDEPNYFSVPVPEGQDGTLWRFDHCSGSRMLLTVPPYLAPSADNLLLPREVVKATGGSG